MPTWHVGVLAGGSVINDLGREMFSSSWSVSFHAAYGQLSHHMERLRNKALGKTSTDRDGVGSSPGPSIL